ncbi:MAG: Sensor histidine kinase RcsC [Pseudomonadota bacterium]
MLPTITTEVIARSMLWFFLVCVELIAITFVPSAPRNHLYYVTTIAIASTITVIALTRFGNFGLSRDFAELCLYDTLCQCTGLLFYFLKIQPTIFIVVTNSIVLLKIVRLLWPVKSVGGAQMATWPVFGLMGLYRWIRGRSQPSGTTVKNDAWAYVAIFLTVLLSYVLLKYSLLAHLDTILESLTIIVIALFFKPFMSHLITQEAAHRTAEAQARSRAEKNMLMRDAAHDVSHLLAPLTVQIQMLAATSDPAQRTALRDNLTAHIAQITATAIDTIHIGKLDTPTEPLALAPLAVADLQARIAIEFGLFTQTRGMQLHTRIRPAHDKLTVLSAPNLLERILINLVSNAIYHSNGSHVTVSFRRHGQRCRIAVFDNGNGTFDGFGPNGQANIDALCERAREKNQGGFGGIGNGLGISNTQRLCGALGARLKLRSRRQAGSVFYFTVPLAQ